MRGATQLLHRQSRARIRIRRARGELRERELAHARARIYAYGISGIVSRAQNFTMMRSSLSLSLSDDFSRSAFRRGYICYIGFGFIMRNIISKELARAHRSAG